MSPVSIDRQAVAAFCQRHHIIRLAVFGSALRDPRMRDQVMSAAESLYVAA